MDELRKIATDVRNYYFQQLLQEYYQQQKHIMNQFILFSSETKLALVTDCELKEDTNKLYRNDMVVFRNSEPVNKIMCWSTKETANDDTVEDDILYFLPYFGKINKTEIEVHPFAWFNCFIIFYPNAVAIRGILDMRFQYWYNRKSHCKPFQNVMHYLDGPFRELDGGQSFVIDFGSAPAESFCDIIKQVCRSGIKKILIY